MAACAATGTGYVDLCGEPAWMRRMIDINHEEAKRTGARIVFSCGFDSIPFDLGVLTLQEKAREKFGRPARRVKARLRKIKGGMSGGTAASAQATLGAAARDPALIRLLTDPFALTPGFSGPSQPSGLIPGYDPGMNALLVPFPMAAINTKNVHRTNFLLGHPYGTDFAYDEMMVAPGAGEIARVASETLATAFSLLGSGGLKPGAGPSREEREKGFYDILFLGELPDGGRVEAVVTGDRDPGYGSTSKMIAESALCLVRDVQGEGGIWTPGALMGPGVAQAFDGARRPHLQRALRPTKAPAWRARRYDVGLLVSSQQAALYAGLAMVGASPLTVLRQVRLNSLERFADRLGHPGAEFVCIVVRAIAGLYGRVKGVDHCHRGVSAAEQSGAELNAADTIGLVAGASLFEHGSCGDELIEKRRLGIGEHCGARLSRHDHREQRDG